MEIMVQGNAKKCYLPDEVRINFDFYTKGETYSEALENGIKNVEEFIEKILMSLNFSKNDLKTKSFNIVEEKKYDYELKKEIKLGYSYRQSASVKSDYSLEMVALFIEKIKEMANPPKCNILFGIKEEETIKNSMLADAYEEAKKKAEVIAKAANKSLKDCIKVDFKPFDTALLSGTNLNSKNFLCEEAAYKLASNSVSEMITNTFTPEDIELEENIYCLWITE